MDKQDIQPWNGELDVPLRNNRDVLMKKNYSDLISLLKYNDNGTLTWIGRRNRTDLNGKTAGTISPYDGYAYIKFRQKRIPAHRVVYFLHNGFFPLEIDHINRVRHDNRIENLRDAITHKNNLGNQSLQKRGKTSKYKGVCFDKNRGKWMAAIKVNRKTVYLGRFTNEELAAEAYNFAADGIFGEFANKNIIPTPSAPVKLKG